MRYTLVSILLALCSAIHASDFEVDGIAYTVLDSEMYDMAEPIVEVTWRDEGTYEGNVTIPASVAWEGTEYKVYGIGNGAFENCEFLHHVVLPEGLNYIDDSAFTGCIELYFPTIPSSLKLIGNYAFTHCKYNLHVATIPENVEALGKGAFADCTELYTIYFPASIKEIPNRCCKGCTNLKYVSIPEGITTIGQRAFDGCDDQLHEVVLPHSVKTIEERAFSAHKLHGIKMYDEVASIEVGTFSGCYFLNYIDIPQSLLVIESQTFDSCANLTSIDIPVNIEEIKNRAFRSCSSVEEIHLRGSNTNISPEAFAVDTAVTDVYCYGEEVVKAHPMAFSVTGNVKETFDANGNTTYAYEALQKYEYIDKATLHVPASLIDEYKKQEPWCRFKEIVAIDGETNKVGDVNHDGNVDTQDVLTLYETMRTMTTKYLIPEEQDINKDTMLDTQDILELYDIIRGE
jgi:hypothetical protein